MSEITEAKAWFFETVDEVLVRRAAIRYPLDKRHVLTREDVLAFNRASSQEHLYSFMRSIGFTYRAARVGGKVVKAFVRNAVALNDGKIEI